jgi:hypothetical protein
MLEQIIANSAGGRRKLKNRDPRGEQLPAGPPRDGHEDRDLVGPLLRADKENLTTHQ